MSGPQDGKYRIQLAASPQPSPIGTSYIGDPASPITIYRIDTIWAVQKLPDGKYHLILEGSGDPWFSQRRNGEVVASKDIPADGWLIQGREGGSYTIAVPGAPQTVWTLPQPFGKFTIALSEIPSTGPLPEQVWDFTLVLDS